MEELNDILMQMNNKTVFVTGATGLVGRNVIKIIEEYNRKLNKNIKILAGVRDEVKAKSIFGDNKDIILYVGDITKKIETNEKIDYIIHTACPTSSKYFIEKPVETIETIVQGTKNVLELAVEKRPASVVYVSSMEIYGSDFDEQISVKETEYGKINTLDVRSSYSEGKRLAETLCIAYQKEYGVSVKIARLTLCFGYGVGKSDNRVFAQFARSILNNKDIVLHTSGESTRNVCDISDATSALFYILIRGNDGEAYNIANNKINISIKDMAKFVAKEFGNSDIQVKVNLDEKNSLGYNQIQKINLNTDKISALGWKPLYGLREMYLHMLDFMKEDNE